MSREQNRVAIITGVRTPYARCEETFRSLGALDLGVIVCREALYRSELLPEQMDETILSQSCSWPQVPYLAHSISVLSGIPQERPAFTVNHLGVSGLQALAVSCERILQQNLKSVMVAGVEASSDYPWLFSSGFSKLVRTLRESTSIWSRFFQLFRFKFSYLKPRDILREYALRLFQRSEYLAKKFGISREEQDRFAMKSHRLSVQAHEEEKFSEELVPVHISPEFDLCVEKDLGPKENLSIETLSQCSPWEGEKGTVTQGNTSFLCDGAASLILASEEFVKAEGIEPLGYIESYAFSGPEGKVEGLGGIFAAEKALLKARRTLQEVDLVEIHEESAASLLAHQQIFSSQEMARIYLGRSYPGEIQAEKINVNGGAIALGHSLGSTGIRLVLTLLMELKRQKLKKGLIVLSSGSSQGGALLLERHI